MNQWMPEIEVENAHGTRGLALRTRHLMARRIFLDGEISAQSAEDFLLQFLYLEDESTEKPIDIVINSPGGEVTAGLLIYDTMQAAKAPVRITCAGMAASMAAILLAGGQSGRRFILPHSRVMIHEPLLSRDVGGSATSIRHISDSIMETRDICNGILAKHTGKTPEEINEATAYDNYMNAAQAVDFGLCDRVVRTLGADGM